MDGASSNKIDDTELEVHIRSKAFAKKAKKKAISKDGSETDDSSVMSQEKKEPKKKKSTPKAETGTAQLVAKGRKMGKTKSSLSDSSLLDMKYDKDEVKAETSLSNSANRKKGSQGKSGKSQQI